LDFDIWANNRVIDVISSLPNPSEKGLERLTHILSAEGWWLGRITNQDMANIMKGLPEWSIKDCQEKTPQISQKWWEYLDSMDEATLNDPMPYTNTKGKTFTGLTLGDIITHVFSHSTYHRGQIATDIKKAGGDLGFVDFIAFATKKS